MKTAYICKGEKDFIMCQKHFKAKGYSWFRGDIFSYTDLKLNIDKVVVLYITDDKVLFGWDKYDIAINETYNNDVEFKVFNSRKKKLERILK